MPPRARPPLLALAAAAALAALPACRREGPPAAPPAAAAPALRLVEPEPVRYAPRTVATGTLRARQHATLAMSVPGVLARVPVRRGQEVRAGAVLALLDDAQAAAALRQAEAGVSAARAQLALAVDALRRVEEIHGAQGTSEADLVRARAQRDLAAAQLAAAEAQRDQAAVQLAHHRLLAPFDGLVTLVPEGVGVTVAPGIPLVTLSSTRTLVLDTTVTQEEAAELRPGLAVRVAVPAAGARAEGGTVAVVLGAVDAATNRVPVEIAVPNPDGRLLANAFARAELPAAAPRDAFRVPAAALLVREAGHAAWVAGADGRAAALPVRLLGEEGADAVVVPAAGGGWPAGLRVIAAPPLGLAEGAPLAAEEPAPPGAGRPPAGGSAP